MTLDRLTVSAIIPVHDGEAFIADAIASVQRQAHEPLEIIVVDDGSTDGTAARVASFGDAVRYVRQPNAGPPAARNTGLGMARGDVIAFLDADDLWTEDKLRCQLALLARHPSVEVVVGQTQLMRLSAEPDGARRFQPALAPALTLNLGGALFRKTAFETVGGFDEALRYDDDVDLFFRLRERRVPVMIHPEVTVLYRRHGGNLTNDKTLDGHYFLMALKKSLDRRRRDGRAARSLPELGGAGE